MNKKIFGAVSAVALLLAGSIVAGPAMADPPNRHDNGHNQSVQNNKNLMRNVGIGLGAAAAYEAIRGHGTNALILGAGAGLAGSQYEKDRKDQAKNDAWHYDSRYDGRNDRRDDRWNDNRRDNDQRNNSRWDNRRDGHDGRWNARYDNHDRFDHHR